MVKDNAHSLLCYSTRVWAAALAAVTIQIYSIRVTNGIVDAINVFTLVFFYILSTFFFYFFPKRLIQNSIENFKRHFWNPVKRINRPRFLMKVVWCRAALYPLRTEHITLGSAYSDTAAVTSCSSQPHSTFKHMAVNSEIAFLHAEFLPLATFKHRGVKFIQLICPSFLTIFTHGTLC